MAFANDRVNEVFPGSDGGLIEVVKRSAVTAFRNAFTGMSLSSADEIHIDMEYPAKKTEYPAIWVSFSLTSLQNSGIGMVEEDRDTGDLLQQFSFTGKVSLNLLAMTSLERDRMADVIISTLAFSRGAADMNGVITKVGSGPVGAYSSLYQEFDENPYLSMTINSDQPKPGGQSTQYGVPWDETQLVYEDNYSFDVIGEFMLVTNTEGFYRLSRIDVYSKVDESSLPDPDGWT